MSASKDGGPAFPIPIASTPDGCVYSTMEQSAGKLGGIVVTASDFEAKAAECEGLRDDVAKVTNLYASALGRALSAEARVKELEKYREDEHARMLSWRDIEPDEFCETCGGSGTRVYGSTATWRGGIGGQALTADVCDKCWGSGNKHRAWPSMRVRLVGEG